jgi:hypothetical protein
MLNSGSQPIINVQLLSVVLSLVLSGYFFWLWYALYLSIEFNELGRYYDAESQIVYTDSAFVWCIPAFGFLFIAIGIIAFRVLQHRRSA